MIIITLSQCETQHIHMIFQSPGLFRLLSNNMPGDCVKSGVHDTNRVAHDLSIASSQQSQPAGQVGWLECRPEIKQDAGVMAMYAAISRTSVVRCTRQVADKEDRRIHLSRDAYPSNRTLHNLVVTP